MKTCIVAALLCFCLSGYAKVHPAEGAKVHYRIVGFEDDELRTSQPLMLLIADGQYQNEDSFRHHIITKQALTTNRFIGEVPSWGHQYTWAIVGQGIPLQLHHFSTGMVKYVDTSLVRLRVVRGAKYNPDLLVFADNFGTLYNSNGVPVWYNPMVEADGPVPIDLRDMKVTPHNTITFLYQNRPIEINWDGRILWQAPVAVPASGSAAEHFHHEFTHLSNGNYMVLGNQKIPNGNGGESEVGTVMEYDAQSRFVWSWNSGKVYNTKQPPAVRNSPNNPGPANLANDPHENAFYFDERKKELYVSFKNVSQVVKVKYPEGKVLNIFGKNADQSKDNGTSPFYEQHSVSLTQSGDLCLFNNNNSDGTGGEFHPEILIMKQKPGQKGNGEVVWQYEYNSEYKKKTIPDRILTNGGTVVELPGTGFFATMCSPYSNFFIVSLQKQLLWEAIPELHDATNNTWMRSPHYRGNLLTTRKQLEDLIWNKWR